MNLISLLKDLLIHLLLYLIDKTKIIVDIDIKYSSLDWNIPRNNILIIN